MDMLVVPNNQPCGAFSHVLLIYHDLSRTLLQLLLLHLLYVVADHRLLQRGFGLDKLRFVPCFCRVQSADDARPTVIRNRSKGFFDAFFVPSVPIPAD